MAKTFIHQTTETFFQVTRIHMTKIYNYLSRLKIQLMFTRVKCVCTSCSLPFCRSSFLAVYMHACMYVIMCVSMHAGLAVYGYVLECLCMREDIGIQS